jgi:uncharacterized protein YjbJ (UPF0337 family)
MFKGGKKERREAEGLLPWSIRYSRPAWFREQLNFTNDSQGACDVNKDRVKGTIDEVVGSAKRHIGNLTGNTGTQVEGAVQQLKGKVENTIGKVKDAAHDATAKRNAAPETEEELERENNEATIRQYHSGI